MGRSALNAAAPASFLTPAPAYHPPAQAPHYRHISAGVLIVDKPAGLLTEPGRGEDKADCLIRRVQAEYPAALIVHRLDMATSGLVVLARGPDGQRALSMQFQQRQVAKRYVAIVAGLWQAEPVGIINLPLSADWPNRPRQKVCHQHGKPSLTRYRLLDVCPATASSRLELEPVTGRTHQLRVHLASIGYPILGDPLYGTNAQAHPPARLLLHASALALTDPLDGTPLQISSPPPF